MARSLPSSLDLRRRPRTLFVAMLWRLFYGILKREVSTLQKSRISAGSENQHKESRDLQHALKGEVYNGEERLALRGKVVEVPSERHSKVLARGISVLSREGL